MTANAEKLDQDNLDALERRYDSALSLRPIGPLVKRGFYLVAIVFALYHYFVAGFGVPVDYWHMGLHLTGLFLLVFTGFPLIKSETAMSLGRPSWLKPGNVPLYDWIAAILGCLAALYLGFSWLGLEIDFFGLAYTIPEQALRQGAPVTSDIVFGTILVVLVLEIARRTLGPILPCIILVFVAYALLGPLIPVQILKHPGVDWRQFINNMYFPQEGIFGVTLWVVSTIVFHFVLFGVVAQRMGLGQFFIDNAMILAGRYTGGPAKVSVVSSAFFGTISGSSIANTVSTGSLTIPNMKRMGYPGHFAGGVEAASSAGGQITPPIMGAASFVMAEFLEVPYTTIVIAAIVPALMHYVGVLSIVHLEARRLDLPSYTKDQLPQLAAVWKEGWPTILPLIVLIYVLFSGYTPYMAAFLGITLCLIVGYSTLKRPLTLIIPLAATAFTIWKTMQGTFAPELCTLLLVCIIVGMLNPRPRQSLVSLGDSMHVAVQYALAVGAAGAAVGIVVGVINTTGIGFRMGFLVTNGAAQMAEAFHALVYWVPGEALSVPSIQLFLSLVLIAIACILMGAGLPTTALYIMLASVAQPTLAQLGVPPLASHMFVLYYGVISEITPPVCASAYAAAGIAGANPFRTGLSAFSLGLGKLVVPMVFVYAPTMLIMLPEHFTLSSFLEVSITCALGVFSIAVAITGFLFAPLNALLRLFFGAAGILLVAPSLESDIAGLVLLVMLVLANRAMPARSVT
ncbi:MAG: TRAP transporter permease [Geminicoccaceae bacterium]